MPLSKAKTDVVKSRLRTMLADESLSQCPALLSAAVHFLSSSGSSEEIAAARALCQRLVATDIVREKYWVRHHAP